ncbi:hypothetical protein C8F01DRAFT_1138531, partial [Mycena amicta]
TFLIHAPMLPVHCPIRSDTLQGLLHRFSRNPDYRIGTGRVCRLWRRSRGGRALDAPVTQDTAQDSLTPPYSTWGVPQRDIIARWKEFRMVVNDSLQDCAHLSYRKSPHPLQSRAATPPFLRRHCTVDVHSRVSERRRPRVVSHSPIGQYHLLLRGPNDTYGTDTTARRRFGRLEDSRGR